jgi:hypothetical protein
VSESHSSGAGSARIVSTDYSGKGTDRERSTAGGTKQAMPVLGGYRGPAEAWRRELVRELYADSGDPT